MVKSQDKRQKSILIQITEERQNTKNYIKSKIPTFLTVFKNEEGFKPTVIFFCVTSELFIMRTDFDDSNFYFKAKASRMVP